MGKSQLRFRTSQKTYELSRSRWVDDVGMLVIGRIMNLVMVVYSSYVGKENKEVDH